MGTDELLRQILADPADAGLRSVYADALLAAGDPRGELIAIECAPPTPERARRRAELRAAHAMTWWGLPAHCVRSERGFATAVAVNGRELRVHRERLARELVESVELRDQSDGGLLPSDLLALPHLRRLAVRGAHTGALLSLASGPLATRFESVDLTGALASVRGPLDHGLPSCRRLVLAHCPLGRTLLTLLRWRAIGQLEELDLRSCGLDGWFLDDLLALDLSSLRVLKLSGNPLGDRGTAVLQRRLRTFPRLERLELVDCDVTDITHAAISDREDLPAAIELAGTTLELVPTGADRHGVLVDGVRRRIRFRALRSQDGEPQAEDPPWSEGDDAPLEPLYRALALGARMYHTVRGARLALGREVVHAYDATYTTFEGAEIWVTGEVPGIELESHTERE